jgi:lysozyme family protein
MNSSFNTCWKLLLINEGGYANIPGDSGHITMYGITEAVARASGYIGDMRDLPIEIAQQIAYRKYWAPYNLDFLPNWAAFQILDTVYNGGQPIRWCQTFLNLQVDGILGPKTQAAISAMNPWEFLCKMNSARLHYMAGLNVPEAKNGWMNRVADNLLQGGLL